MNRVFEKKRLSVVVMALALMILFVIVLFCDLKEAQGHSNSKKTVTSVYINEGDSLWSIASRFYSDECGDMDDYIDEICDTNHLTSSTIHAGNYLIIPYYY